jgi:hypothetical protein
LWKLNAIHQRAPLVLPHTIFCCCATPTTQHVREDR